MEKGLFAQKASAFIKKHMLLTPSDKVLVAISGGADSVALLFTLHDLGYECAAVHCNFHLRGDESMRDQRFVEALCTRIKIPYYIKDFDVRTYCLSNGISTEMAARELRYEWFEEMRQELNCAKIAVAHHHDDNVETFFLNLLRGSGISGLSAIKPLNGYIVRPLLEMTRIEIESYLSELNEDFIIDSTNAENNYKRNRIRNIILPAIKEQFPDADATISRTIKNLYSCNEVFQTAINQYRAQFLHQIESGIYRIDLDGLYPLPGFSAILYELLKEFGFNSFQVDDIISAYNKSHTGRTFDSREYLALLNRDNLDIELKITSPEPLQTYPMKCEAGEFFSPFHLKIEILPNIDINFKTPSNIVYFNSEMLNKEFILRHWEAGDRFSPFGVVGKKKLSDLFSDLKFSKMEKDRAWLMTIKGEIIWVVGIRRSIHLLPGKMDKEVIKMEIFD